MSSSTLLLTSSLGAAPPCASSMETRLSMNSLEAISAKKCEPPFFTHVSVSYTELVSFVMYQHVVARLTPSAASCTFGFLLPIRRLSDLIASFGCTVFDRMMSDISKFRAMSSKLEDVARSTCSSSAELLAPNQDDMLASCVTAPCAGWRFV